MEEEEGEGEGEGEGKGVEEEQRRKWWEKEGEVEEMTLMKAACRLRLVAHFASQ